MYGFTGLFCYTAESLPEQSIGLNLLERMSRPLCHLPKDNFIPLYTPSFGGSVICHLNESAPFTIQRGDRACHILMEGSIFNQKDLCSTPNLSLPEFILNGFMEYGIDFMKKLNGNYSIAICDEKHETLYLFRDCFGSRPLFYMQYENYFYFATELKSLLSIRKEPPTISRKGLNEIFAMGPARTPGQAIFDDIHEVKAACCLSVNRYGICSTPYWTLRCRPHYETYQETILHTKDLLEHAIASQCDTDSMESPDGRTCALLSGGVDSSIVSAILQSHHTDSDTPLTTVSFDFAQNEKYFKSSAFQPSQDRPYVDALVRFLQSKHHYLECGFQTLADLLSESVHNHDLPCMADIDTSLLYFSGKVTDIANVAYTGECADEVFGGYPWMHGDDSLLTQNFPWAKTLAPRKALLNKDFLEFLNIDDYVTQAYQKAISKIPVLPEESTLDAGKRRYGYLNLYWFMQTLLNRMDRSCRATGLVARVPFADRDLIEYVYNVPWAMKAHNGLVKSLLRQTAEELLPPQILMRPKSPFPKTYHPYYEKLLVKMLSEVIRDSASPLHLFMDADQVQTFLNAPKDYGAPWYGQLMCGPQMIAYLLQIDTWIKDYQIRVLT